MHHFDWFICLHKKLNYQEDGAKSEQIKMLTISLIFLNCYSRVKVVSLIVLCFFTFLAIT